MQLASYAEILGDDQSDAREREGDAFDRSIALMEQAARPGATPVERATAISFARRLWMILIEDLGQPGNALPAATKAQIISIGIWVLRTLEQLRDDPRQGFADIIAVSASLREGLR
jgi:flagellar biosynthesis activator protein FlaF